MKSPNRAASWAGLMVVLAGSGSFLFSAFRGSYEIATASAAFAGVGLYLLFGKNPPSSSALR